MNRSFGIIFTCFFCIALNAQSGDFTRIRIETSMGNMVIRLYNETPLHRNNMIRLANEGYYKDLLFHRVIKDFMAQGGDPHSRGAQSGQRLGTGGPDYTIPAEFNPAFLHKKGAIAAARRGDQVNPEQRSSGSQFYLVQGRVFSREELSLMEQRGMHRPFTEEEIEIYTTLGGAPHLDGTYTVFGEIVEGLDVLDNICNVSVDAYDRPLEDIVFDIQIIDK